MINVYLSLPKMHCRSEYNNIYVIILQLVEIMLAAILACAMMLNATVLRTQGKNDLQLGKVQWNGH